MNYFVMTTILLTALYASACTSDDYVLHTPPPGCSAGGGNDTNDPEGPDNPPSTSNAMKITVGNVIFTATLEANATSAAFKAMLPLTLTMSDFNNNEKVCALPNSLSTTPSNPGTIQTGDIMLYGTNSLVLFYETFMTSYSYTRIGRVDNVSGLKAALGAGDAILKFELEEHGNQRFSGAPQ